MNLGDSQINCSININIQGLKARVQLVDLVDPQQDPRKALGLRSNNTPYDIQHNNISHLWDILFSLIISLNIHLQKHLYFCGSWSRVACSVLTNHHHNHGHLLTGQGSMRQPLNPAFCNPFCANHLSSKWIDDGGNTPLWPSQCCHLTVIQLRRSLLPGDGED